MMKDMLKSSKGLTLLELLAVVVILSIVSVIAIPAIANIIENTRNDAVQANAAQLVAATKTYVTAEGINIDENSSIPITLQTLIDKGYISSIINPQTKEYYKPDKTKVEITRTGNNYEYTVIWE